MDTIKPEDDWDLVSSDQKKERGLLSRVINLVPPLDLILQFLDLTLKLLGVIR